MHPNNFKDLTGLKFERLTVMRFEGRINRQSHWLCKCDCGTEKIVAGVNLKNRRIKSCGCLRAENSTSHGYAKIPEYKVWNTMIQRCTNKRNKSYEEYGGRNITVCDSWLEFSNFISNMGRRPSSKHSIDRKDNNKGYYPDNCHWTTMMVQSRNTRISIANTSGYKGVHFFKRANKYQAFINPNDKCGRKHLGYFDNIEDAIKAREDAEIKYWGESS